MVMLHGNDDTGYKWVSDDKSERPLHQIISVHAYYYSSPDYSDVVHIYPTGEGILSLTPDTAEAFGMTIIAAAKIARGEMPEHDNPFVCH